MSRFSEVVVLAREAEDVMEHLTEPDDSRAWHQCFTRVDDSVFAGTYGGSGQCYAWVIQFGRNTWWGFRVWSRSSGRVLIQCRFWFAMKKMIASGCG